MGRTRSAEWIWCADDMMEILLAFIERVMPGERFLLAGESYGGYLAQGIVHYLGKRVMGLLLLCSVVETLFKKRVLPPRKVLITDEALLQSLSPEDAASFTESNVIQTPEVWARFRDEVLSGLRVSDQPFLKAFQQNGYRFSFDVGEMDEPFSNPALILAGRQDDCVGYRDTWSILENYPRATFAVLDRSGHNLQIEQPALFRALTLEWLERVKEASR
jgi:pimeloyl-ACP methyl ester carboxylesterase